MLAVEPLGGSGFTPTDSLAPQSNVKTGTTRHITDALRASKRLHASITSTIHEGNAPDRDTLRRWRDESRLVNKALVTSSRYYRAETDRLRMEVAIIKVEAAKDLLDERAHAARVIERIRGSSNISDGCVSRAVASTRAVQNAISALCPAPETCFYGVSMLHEDVTANRDSLDHCFAADMRLP